MLQLLRQQVDSVFVLTGYSFGCLHEYDSEQNVTRIFLTLALVANIALIVTAGFGLSVGDVQQHSVAVQSEVSRHMLIGLAAMSFVTLVHAISFTYFMGTGRWLEETSRAYSLDDSWHSENQKIKYRTLPGTTAVVLLIICTGALGAVADPATPASLDGTLGLSSAQIHFFTACLTVLANMWANAHQFLSILRNSRIVDGVMGEVRRIRLERGLPVE